MGAEQPDIKQVERDLESATVTPISELGPHLTGPTKRSIRGVITIVWPYSIVTKSLSFVLAEPDFRLRRQKGQVRVIFVGQCARTLADASLGGGDEVLLSLEGVEWVEGDAPGIAGATLEWHAKFTSGVLLRAHGEQFKDPRVIYVDPANAPSTVEPPLPTLTPPPFDEVPNTPATPEPILPTKRRRQEALDPDEYASPAFIKRARVSYGSLFEGAFDLFFDDDFESSRQNRRRSRFGRDSSAWRYTSRSRSPEPEATHADTTPSKRIPEDVPSDQPRPEPEATHTEATPSVRTHEEVPSDEPRLEPEAIQTETTPSGRTLEEVPMDKPHPEPTAMQVEEEPRKHALEVPSNESRSLKHPTMVDEGSQTSELLLPPPTPSSLQREEGTAAHEPGATLIGVTHINGDDSSPIQPHNATVDQHPDFERIPLQTVPGGVQSADVAQPPLFHTQHTTFTSFQEQRLHPSSEPGIHIPLGAFSNNPTPWGSSVPYATMQSSHESTSTSFTSHHDVSPYPDLSPSFTAQFQQHARGLQLPAVAGQGIAKPHVEPQRSEAHEISSDVESAQGDVTDGEPVAEAEVHDQPPSVERNIRTLLPERSSADKTAGSFTDVRERHVSEIMSPAAEELDLEEDGAFPSDEGDEAEDYDTQAHTDTQDDEEDVSDEEYSGNYDEMDEGTYDAGGGRYGQEGEYEDEGEDEDEEQGANEEWEGASQSTAPPASPVFIDLISDSEDEDVQGQKADSEGHEEDEEKEAAEVHQQANAAKEAEKGVSDESHEEEEYSEDEEDEGRIPEDLELEGEDEGKSPMQVREPTPSSGQDDEADGEAHHDHVVAGVDQDEAEGAEDFDMVASAPHFVAPLSSPPPEAPTSPVTVQAAEPSGSTEPVVTKQALCADLKQENAKPETPECDSTIVADGVQPVADQAAEDEPSPTPVSPMDAEKTSTRPLSQEADVGVDEDIQMRAASPERYASQPVTSPIELAEDSDPPEPISSMEDESSGLVGSTSEADVEDDTHMSDASPDQHTLQPATPPVQHARDSLLPQSTSSIDAEEGRLQEQPTREAGANEDSQVGIASSAQHAVPPATPPVQHARGSPPPKSTTPVETKDRQLQEQSPRKEAAEEDSRMGIASPIQHISQPTTPPIKHAREPLQADMADNDEMDVDIPIPVREALDEQVQADIERQVLEESSFIGLDEADAVANGETVHSDGASSHLQSPAKDAVAEEVPSDRPARAQEPASPPLTQATQPLELEVTKAEVREEIVTVTDRPETDHLLTPDATQLTSTAQSFEAAVTMGLSGESSEGASKAALESPTLESSRYGDAMTPVGIRPDGPSSSPHSSQPVEEGIRADDRGYSAEGFAITVNSLRSERHRRKLSLEKSEVSRRDPSTRMARASIAARERSQSAKRDSSVRRATRSSPTARHAAAASDTASSPRLPRRTTRSRARSSQMSATPEPPQPKSPELGDVAAGAGPRGGADSAKETESQSILQLQLSKNLRLSLLDFTALKVLRNNVNKKVDVLGVATAQPASPQRPKHGPRDYLLSLSVTDQTTCPNNVVVVQVFRPHIESLPVVKEGDVVLLRQFAVTALRDRDFGLRSCETSSWAVWEAGRDDGLPQIKGPPVEVAPEEAVQAGLLLRWYAGLGGRAREKLARANARMELAPARG